MDKDDGAMSMMAELLDTETEEFGEVALPVHVPDIGGEVAFTTTDSARSDEVRGLLAVIRRLESLVEEETFALETRKKIDFDDFSMRKSRSLLEFVRLMRARKASDDESEVATEIQKLRQKLEKNRRVLEMHFEAAREVAAIIVRAIREAESDGTYSANALQESK